MPPNEQERPPSIPTKPEDPDTAAIFTAVRERMSQDGFAPPEEYERSAAWPLREFREDRDG